MAKRGKFKFLSIFLVLILILSACSSGSGSSSSSDSGSSGGEKGKEKEEVYESQFPKTVVNDKEEIEGGSINVALVSSTPFEGTLDWQFYEGTPDCEVLDWFSEPIFGYDENYQITNDVESAAKFELSEDHKTITITIEDGVYWHNGEPLEAEDYAYSYYIIGHPDYQGVRYGDTLISDIVGMEEYHAGKTDEISGIEVVDEKTVKITWKEANPSILSGIWAYAAPKDHYGDVPIGELINSEKIRTDVVGFGPFKVKNIVPGESVEYEAFEDYYGGKPKLDSVVLKVVSPQTIKKELESGNIDIATFPSDQYETDYEPSNFQLLGRVENAYTYIAFKLGRWDEEKGEAVQDRDTPLQDVELRKAMAYAIDNDAIAKNFYNGLRSNASTLMIPFFEDFHNPDIEGYYYDPEKAKEILDNAGYKDVDGDGYREDKDGNKMVFNFASMDSGETSEPVAQAYIQWWDDIGIKVQLLEGRLHEFNSFYDRIEQDDPAIDIYQAAWSTGTDPDPYGLYSKYAKFNYPRYVNEENEQLLADGHSEDAFDFEYRKEVYDKWQQHMVDNVPVIPTLYRIELFAVNNRVKDYTLEVGTDWGYEDIAVTSEQPEK
jgi:peptide/nickel transport system substrate-binding protein